MGRGAGLDAREDEYWDWLTAVLFLLVTVDMVTTVYAVHAVGLAAEANPLVRWAVASGPVAFAALNVAAVVVVAALFDRVVARLRRTPAPLDRYLATGIEAWLGVLLAAGLLVFANNLLVVVHGWSLL